MKCKLLASRKHLMAYSDIVFTSAVALLADKPSCLHCGSRMSVIKIERFDLNLSQRTFDCPYCDREKQSATQLS